MFGKGAHNNKFLHGVSETKEDFSSVSLGAIWRISWAVIYTQQAETGR